MSFSTSVLDAHTECTFRCLCLWGAKSERERRRKAAIGWPAKPRSHQRRDAWMTAQQAGKVVAYAIYCCWKVWLNAGFLFWSLRYRWIMVQLSSVSQIHDTTNYSGHWIEKNQARQKLSNHRELGRSKDSQALQYLIGWGGAILVLAYICCAYRKATWLYRQSCHHQQHHQHCHYGDHHHQPRQQQRQKQQHCCNHYRHHHCNH